MTTTTELMIEKYRKFRNKALASTLEDLSDPKIPYESRKMIQAAVEFTLDITNEIIHDLKKLGYE